MWLESLFEKITSFIPRPVILNPSEGGFRQTPKPWAGWPWDYWPWIRWEWVKNPRVGKPWSPKDSGLSTWVTPMNPGNWYLLVPLFMEHLVVPVKTDVKDVRIQSAWTADGQDIAIGVAIRYYVSNPMKAILEVTDYDESIQNVALGVVSDYVETHTEEELRKSRSVLKDELLEALREESKGWGLKIQSVKVTDVGRTQNFRILIDDKFGVSI